MESANGQQRDAFKEITFKFDDITTNTDVVIHRKRRPNSATTAVREEEDFRRNCRDMNTSTPKKSDVKTAINEARSSFFGLDDISGDRTVNGSQMDTADLLANCTEDSAAESSCRTCDINNNSGNSGANESGIGSISEAVEAAVVTVDEMDSKICPEKELLLENGSEKSGQPMLQRNIIREPQYYPGSLPNPSQAVYLSTTVPQNIKSNKIMGRHTPSRSSLRHSRMLVISKDLRGALNPLNIFHPKWATFCLILHILMGLLITAIGVWFLLWAPNTRIQDNPYWSGLILILCGSMGVVVMEFKRIPRNASRERCFNLLRINLLVVLFVTAIITFAAFAFAAVHSVSLFAINTVCIPANLFSKSASCVCVFDKPIVDMHELQFDHSLIKPNDTLLMDSHRVFLNLDDQQQFHYRDLNCNEVIGAFKLILLGSSLANLIAFIATLGFLMLYYHGTRQINLYAQPPPAPSIVTTIN